MTTREECNNQLMSAETVDAAAAAIRKILEQSWWYNIHTTLCETNENRIAVLIDSRFRDRDDQPGGFARLHETLPAEREHALDCSTGPRVIAPAPWFAGQIVPCQYCGVPAMFDSERWHHVSKETQTAIESLCRTVAEVQEQRLAAAVEGSNIKAAFNRFCGFVLTCRKQNQREWMEMLAEQLNEAAKVLEPNARFEFDGDGIRRAEW